MVVNCLTYLLEIFKGDFTILSNENHYIGVNKTEIIDFENQFKEELLSGKSYGKYIPIQIGDEKRIKKIFNLNEKHSQLLDNYFEHE